MDVALVAFFLLNLCFITYIVDLEQLVIANPAHFTYPWWPPAPLVNLVHWWGRTYDPLLLARPVWWKATIWIDELTFGPFYVVAVIAFVRRLDWIRLLAVMWATAMVTNVTIILSAEFAGAHATPHPAMVLLANLPWLLGPTAAVIRMAPSEHPSTRPLGEGPPR